MPALDTATLNLKQLYVTATALDVSSDEPSLTISTINPDRVGDRVIPEGGRFEHFMKNPALLWGHDYGSIPIGTVTRLDVVPGAGIRASWRWLEGDAFADRVKNAWTQGVIRASSIGFRVLESARNAETKGEDIASWELLELSLCAIPMNPEAVRTLKGLMEPEDKPEQQMHTDMATLRADLVATQALVADVLTEFRAFKAEAETAAAETIADALDDPTDPVLRLQLADEADPADVMVVTVADEPVTEPDHDPVVVIDTDELVAVLAQSIRAQMRDAVISAGIGEAVSHALDAARGRVW